MVTHRVPELAGWPAAGESDLLVSLGSDCSVHASADAWIEREIEHLRAAHDAGVPVLGHLLRRPGPRAGARGEVFSAPGLSRSGRPRLARPELMPPGPWFRWHEDMFTVPPGARELGRTGEVPLAFSHGSELGVQFHPEVTGEIAKGWIEGARRELADNSIDEGALRTEIDRCTGGARERAADLFDRLAELGAAAGRPTLTLWCIVSRHARARHRRSRLRRDRCHRPAGRRLPLPARQEGDLQWAAAARDSAKLERVLADVGVSAPETIAADVADPGSLGAMAARARSCWTLWAPTRCRAPGHRRVHRAGAHYLDLTGEITFARHVIDERNGPAAEAGVKIVRYAGSRRCPPTCSC